MNLPDASGEPAVSATYHLLLYPMCLSILSEVQYLLNKLKTTCLERRRALSSDHRLAPD